MLQNKDDTDMTAQLASLFDFDAASSIFTELPTASSQDLSLSLESKPLADATESTIEILNEVPEWPQGNAQVVVTRSYGKAPDHKNWSVTGWAWDSRGTKFERRQNALVARRKCLGVWACPNVAINCPYTLRPLTKGRLASQADKACPHCQLTLEYTNCSAKSAILDSEIDQTLTWIHYGLHYHARPCWGSMNTRQEAALKDLVLTHSEATPTELQRTRTLISTGQAVSALDINPKLSNRGSLRYQQNKILTEAGVVSKTSKGTDTFLIQLKTAQQENMNWIQFSSLAYRREMIIMQSPFMKSCLDMFYSTTNNQSGYLTDAAHGFFEHGLMLVTVGFLPMMSRWMPVLISWIGSNTAACYEQHFLHLMRAIQQSVAPNAISDDHLSNVIDFSEAERQGFVAAYCAFHRELILESLLVSKLTAQNLQDFSNRNLSADAAACLKGCEYHFDKSVTKVKNNARFVPVEKSDEFAFLVNSLKTCDIQAYDATVKIIRSSYPGTHHWLEWWTDTRHAGLIFQCKQSMDHVRSDQIPNTTNACEAVHRQIYIACKAKPGTRFNVIHGIQALWLFDNTNQDLAENCKMGYQLSYGTQERSRVKIAQYGTSRPLSHHKRKAEHENDGRSVDNTAKLIQAHKRDAAANSLEKTDFRGGIRFFMKGKTYQSTPWEDNLCYLDTLIEVFYNSFMRSRLIWDLVYQVMDDDYSQHTMYFFLRHMQDRYKLYEMSKHVDELQDGLISIRNALAAALSANGLLKRGDFGSATDIWEQMISSYRNPDIPTQLREATHLKSIAFTTCNKRHLTKVENIDRHEFILPIIDPHLPGSCQDAVEPINSMLKFGLYKELTHCSTCRRPALRVQVAYWRPTIIFIEENVTLEKSRARYLFPPVILLPDPFSSSKREHVGEKNHYLLSSRILFSQSEKHYTALIRDASRNLVFSFDGQRKNSNAGLQKVADGRGFVTSVDAGSRVSAHRTNELLTQVSHHVTTAVYTLASNQSYQMQHFHDIKTELTGLGLELTYDNTQGVAAIAIDQRMNLPRFDQIWSLLYQQEKNHPGSSNTALEKALVGHAQTAFHRRCNEDTHQSNQQLDGVVQIPEDTDTEIQSCTTSRAQSDHNMSHLDTDSNDSCPELHPVHKNKRIKPSYQYVLEPAGKAAPKQFIPETNLPPRTRRFPL